MHISNIAEAATLAVQREELIGTLDDLALYPATIGIEYPELSHFQIRFRERRDINFTSIATLGISKAEMAGVIMKAVTDLVDRKLNATEVRLREIGVTALPR